MKQVPWIRLASFASLFAIWVVAAHFLDETVLPGPAVVAKTIWRNLQEGETYHHIAITLLRVGFGMLLAIGVGLVLGIVMGTTVMGERFFDSWVMVGLTIPAVIYGIVAILWFGINDRAAVIAIGISAFPSVAINIWQGVKAIDLSLIQMGRAFRLRRMSIIRKVVIPQTIPYLMAAVRYALGISWKIATTIELIGMGSGVGYMLHHWFGLFSMKQVLAWTLTFTIVLLLIEFLLLKPADRFVTRWRPSVQAGGIYQ
ncbi:MAG TPA: ABC transporter permease [Myxococcaceae bacterium]|nr:ABC transporter permease [Myxococcaceae bacterium]